MKGECVDGFFYWFMLKVPFHMCGLIAKCIVLSQLCTLILLEISGLAYMNKMHIWCGSGGGLRFHIHFNGAHFVLWDPNLPHCGIILMLSWIRITILLCCLTICITNSGEFNQKVGFFFFVIVASGVWCMHLSIKLKVMTFYVVWILT